MSGLLRRLTRRRAATADETPPAQEASESTVAPAQTPAETGGDQPVPAPDDQPTERLPTTGESAAVSGADSTAVIRPDAGEAHGAAEAPASEGPPASVTPLPVRVQQPSEQEIAARDLPAGVDPGELQGAPSPSSRRGKLRRRLRYLRQVRELLLRDLGGFTYEIHRTAGGVLRESHRRLVEGKTDRLATLDAEVRELETRLSMPHAEQVLRQPGVGGACPVCGELFSSDAHYCSRCGEPLDDKARARREEAIRAAAQPAATPHPSPEPKAASVLWAAGPRPASSAAPEAERAEGQASPATSEWLLGGAKPAAPGEAPQDESAGAAGPGTSDEPAADVAARDEARVESADEARGEPTDQTRDEPGDQTRDESADQSRDEPIDHTRDEPTDQTRDEPTDQTRDEPADQARDEPGDQARADESGETTGDQPPTGGASDDAASRDPNGRRDEDGSERLGSGDPLGSWWERRS
jgi:hypothetical protein